MGLLYILLIKVYFNTLVSNSEVIHLSTNRRQPFFGPFTGGFLIYFSHISCASLCDLLHAYMRPTVYHQIQTVLI